MRRLRSSPAIARRPLTLVSCDKRMITQPKVAIVTAAGRGIGAAIARKLAADGYCVALLSPSEPITKLASELGGLAVQGSVTVPADLQALVHRTMARWGRIDALVNNAGHPPKGPLLDITDGQWQSGFEMVFLSAVRMTRLVTPHMIAGGGGAIVNISSYAALEPETDFPMTTLRAALGAWTKLYADTYAPSKIRMNAVLPGFTDSLPVKAERRARIPMGRYAKPEEIAAVVAFLLSNEAGYVTGQNIRVDGGITRSAH
jgi:NAD(P)-dependent dehydrogenase (short-subunit alcohol dehydrogenase family)